MSSAAFWSTARPYKASRFWRPRSSSLRAPSYSLWESWGSISRASTSARWIGQASRSSAPLKRRIGVPDSICDYLPWDSSFFGLRVARLAPTCLSVNNLSDALEWCRLNRIDCLYFLGVSDHSEAARLAEGANFQFVDVRV